MPPPVFILFFAEDSWWRSGRLPRILKGKGFDADCFDGINQI